MESLIKNHPFIGGNKRTALASAGIFLERNGYSMKTTPEKLETFTRKMSEGRVTVSDAAKWFKKHSEKNE